MCFRENIDMKPDPKDMKVEEFKRILAAFPEAIFFHIQGNGEPLLNREIFTFVKLAKERGNIVRITTNGTLLDRERVKALLESGLDYLAISIDGATKATFESIRVGADFDNLKEKVRYLTVRKDELKKDLFLSMWVTITESNKDELVELLGLAYELGFDEVRFQCAQNYDKRGNLLKSDLSLITDETLKRLDELGKQKGIYVVLPDEIKDCDWSFKRVYVDCNGDVTPCCELSAWKLGNIYKEPFTKIWNSPSYIKFRDVKKNHKSPCRECNFF